MHPKPRAETSRLLFPSLRICTSSSCDAVPAAIRPDRTSVRAPAAAEKTERTRWVYEWNSTMPGTRPREELSVLAAFAVVADERSFTRAAVRLGVSTSAVSHSIRALEERLGVRLLARTTRTVAPTDAGQHLLEQLRPALGEIEAALTEVGRLREKPAGTIRLIAPPIAVAMAVSPKLAKFTRDYPDVVLDITTEDDSRRDLIAARFDAGIHLGEFLQRDMVAVKVSAEQRAAIVAAPSYFDSHPKPKTPRDLTAHQLKGAGCRPPSGLRARTACRREGARAPA